MDIDCGVEFPTDEKAVLGISHALVRRMREHSVRLEFAKTLFDAL
jgi:hypothetical protein